MYKVRFQNFKLRAEQLEIINPQVCSKSGEPLEYEIYANGVKLGTTTDRVLSFRLLLENAYELEKAWRSQVEILLERGSQVMPDPEFSQGQTLMMDINKCPVDEDEMGEKTDACWASFSVNLINEWMAVPCKRGRIDEKYVVAEVQ